MIRVVMPQRVDLQLVLSVLKENVVPAHASSRVQVPHAEGPVGSAISKNGVPASQQNVHQTCTFKMGHLVIMGRPTASRATARHMTRSAKHTSEQVSVCVNSHALHDTDKKSPIQISASSIIDFSKLGQTCSHDVCVCVPSLEAFLVYVWSL